MAAAGRQDGQTGLQHKHSLGLQYLAQSTALLRLSVDASERVAAWDVIILTAASPHQARLYETQLAAVRHRGLIGEQTMTLVAEDPEGLAKVSEQALHVLTLLGSLSAWRGAAFPQEAQHSCQGATPAIT